MKSVSLFALCAAVTFVGTAPADEPPPRSPELEVLDRFVGTWDIEATIRTPDGAVTRTKGVGTRRWSKHGDYLLFEDPNDQEFHMALTHDPVKQRYRGAAIVNAVPSFVNGTWDAKTSTLSLVLDGEDGNEFRGTHVFPREGYTEAEGKLLGPDGKPLLDFSWRQTRRKE